MEKENFNFKNNVVHNTTYNTSTRHINGAGRQRKTSRHVHKLQQLNKFTKYTESIIVNNRPTNEDSILDLQLQLYYVYSHKKADTNELFYIGKGKNNRCISANYHNPHWAHIVNKHGYYIEIFESNLSEHDAFELEKKLISQYGRLDLKTGILCNMTDGGEGSTNIIFSNEYREYKRTQMLGDKNHRFGKRFYGESNPNFGKTGKDSKLSKPVIALNFEGIIIKEYISVKETILDGYIPGNVSECCTGKRAQHGNTQFIFKSDYDITKNYIYKRGRTSIRSIVKTNKEGSILLNFYNCIQDVKKDGYSPKVVQGVCSGKKKSHLGFNWYYCDNLPDHLKCIIKEKFANKI